MWVPIINTMKSRFHNIFKFWLVVFFLILVCIYIMLPRRGQKTILEHPFDDVVSYMNVAFQTNLTACSSGWAWGPTFLSTGTVYFVETKLYIPRERLYFEAWFSQIGGEYNYFSLHSINDSHTRLSIYKKTVPFSALLTPFNWVAEKRILHQIKNGMKAEDSSRFQFDDRSCKGKE